MKRSSSAGERYTSAFRCTWPWFFRAARPGCCRVFFTFSRCGSSASLFLGTLAISESGMGSAHVSEAKLTPN